MATSNGDGNGVRRVATAGSGNEVRRATAMECAKWQWLATAMQCVEWSASNSDGNGVIGSSNVSPTEPNDDDDDE
jgi:hypothetical protein